MKYNDLMVIKLTKKNNGVYERKLTRTMAREPLTEKQKPK
jgi:hypothetical protein